MSNLDEDPSTAATVPSMTVVPATEATSVGPGPGRWSVWQGNFRVLRIVGEPGPLISTAPPPPGDSKLVQHPFLSATAELPSAEHELRELLLASTTISDYLDRLRSAGYRVQQEPNRPEL